MKKTILAYTAAVILIAIAFTLTAMADSPNKRVIDLDSTSISIITTTTESPISDYVEIRQSILFEDEGVVDTTTTTTTIFIASDALCPQWWETAKTAGWPEELLPKLDRVIHRESTCRENSYNPNDPAGGSYGLTQINGYWCTVNKYNPSGWLQAQGILNSCQDLFDPVTNFRAAMALYMYSLNRHGCGWNPWRFC